MSIYKKILIKQLLWMFLWVVTITALIVALMGELFVAFSKHETRLEVKVIAFILFLVFWVAQELHDQMKHFKKKGELNL